ncbi:AMIN domain-containing protein [Roseofilum sp. BLCC_M143]|uniref:AMIN domain-containing protein n=2 Tax=Roseofilum TaxID=1233426 RepID=A0ABT7BZK5_9CYAN|nr:AMIN domain-containing protein [Roseofilum casamattae BLCC-M143]
MARRILRQVKYWVVVAMFCAAIAFYGAIAKGAELTNWNFDPLQAKLELILDRPVIPRYSLAGNPPRLIIVLPDTNITASISAISYTGAVQRIVVERSNPDETRFILKLSPGVELRSELVQTESTVSVNGEHLTAIRLAIAGERPAEIGTSPVLPPANFDTPKNPPLVRVPPLYSRQSDRNLEREERPTPGASAASLNTKPASVETTPNLVGLRIVNSTESRPQRANSAPLPPIGSSQIPTIAFGQAIPDFERGASSATGQLLPRGTRLRLRYSGDAALSLTPEIPVQEVLFVDKPVRDNSGRTIVPVGTLAIGQFETSDRQIRFRVSALIIGDRAVPIEAQSAVLNRANSRRRVIIQPGQVIEVR